MQAMHGLYSAVRGAEAFVKFVGQPRTGKSGVCEKLTQFLRHKDYRVVYFDYAVESPDMLRSMLAKEMDIPDTFNFFRQLEDVRVSDSDKPVIIIFDDAHLLSDITLIEIYRLTEVQIAGKRVINVVLCGEPILEKRLNSKHEFKSLLHQVSHNFLLEPMDAETTSHFLLAFFEKMHLPGLQLEPAAMSQFYKSCKGFPGPAYSLCQLILSIREGDRELQTVSREELLRAIRSADSEQPIRSGDYRVANRWLLIGPVAVVLVIGSLAMLFQQLNTPDSGNNDGLAGQPQTLLADDANQASPFAVDETTLSLVENSTEERTNDGGANTPADVVTDDQAAAVSLREQQLIVADAPFTDSNLALVTAQERGIALEVIAEPEFEELGTTGTVNLDAGDTPTFSLSNDEEPTETSINLAAVPENALAELPIERQSEVQTDVSGNLSETNQAQQTIEDSSAVAMSPSSSQATPQSSVQTWLDAWQGQDLEGYFSSYDSAFVPRYHRSKNAWRSNRERVIGNAGQISLTLSDFVIVGEDAQNIEVHFWLAYRSPTYRDDTRKKLILRKLPANEQESVKFLILEEINLEVRV